MFNKFSLFILLAVFASTLFAQKDTIKIVETSDVHGMIFPYDLVNDRDSRGSLAQVTSYLKELRADNKNVILLDNGDILQGTPVVYYYNFEKQDVPHLYAEVMNYMNYDAGSVGNHDIETGHDVYDRFNAELKFPWLAANAIKNNSEETYFKPYTVIEKNGIKVAVLGLITPHIPHWLPENLWSGMHYTDMIETAKKWVKVIEENEKPDVIVGLFHAGADETYNNPEGTAYMNENASMLVAKEVPGFDIVLVGHDHQGWNQYVENSAGEKVLLMGTESRASDVAKATVVFDRSTGETEITGDIVSMKNYSPDPEFMEKFAGEFEEVKEYVNKPVGVFTKSISTRDAMFGDSEFTDLIHTIQMNISGADVSFSAPLSFNSYIDSGKIYVKDLFKLYRYENLLYTMEMTGKEIDGFLEHSYKRWFEGMDDENGHLINFKTDANGEIVRSDRGNGPVLEHPYYNFDSAEGIMYEVDVAAEPGSRVKIISMQDGSEFYENKTYKVAVNSYRGNGGGGHLTEGAGIPAEELENRIVNSTDKDLRYYMMKWIEKEGTVTPEETGNWKVVPAGWYEKARELDRQLMYGK